MLSQPAESISEVHNPALEGPVRYDPYKHHRRSLRLKGYDYSGGGLYFITVCVRARETLLGDVVGGEMRSNGAGDVVRACWETLPDRFLGSVSMST